MKRITTLIITLLALTAPALAQHGMSIPPAPKIADADTDTDTDADTDAGK